MNMGNIYKSNSFLSFTLGDESFATNVAKVLNILEMIKIIKVPKSPDYMLGVINLRGSVLPLIDLRIKFGMKQTAYTTKTCILVLEVEIDKELLKVGALVDSVQEVFEVTPEKIQPPPNIGSKYKSDIIYGIAKISEEFIMLLDMDKIFLTQELTDLKYEPEKISKKESKENLSVE
ncbi:MAG: chemotaxis protein CheW [Bacteroidales bacterium]|nr:chemotaxis protein CheW [Bacteroidales bacterium]